MAPVPPPTKEHPLFHYHANAYAFSAHFTRPFEHQIDVQAPSALCVMGGHSSARVEDFKFCEFIRFDAAYTHLSGGHHAGDNSNNTLVTSVIEGLNMFDILTAERIVARLYSRHPHRAPEGLITMHGSKFENLRICGHPVTMNLDFQLFEDIQTFQQAQDAYGNINSAFYRAASDPFQTGQALPQQNDDGAFLCSLATGGIKIGSSDPMPAHSIYVPGFGTVYFAEVFLTHGQRSLTMLRFQFGSTTSGSGSAVATTTNGKQWPPP